MLIKNAKIHTMSGGDPVIDEGWILAEDGKIEAFGDMRSVPGHDGEVIDVQGRVIIPGIIDAHCHVGMEEDSLGFEGNDLNESTDPVTPHLRAIDAVNPMDRCFEEALAAGITTVVTGPGSANPIGGRFAAMHTFGRRVDSMVIRENVCMKFALGENPKKVYHQKGKTPVTRMATAALIREYLYKAKEYARRKDSAVRDDDTDEPSFDIRLEALVPVVEKAMPAHFHAHRLDDIYTAIRIAREFDLDFAIVHATEAHLDAETLAGEGVRVITGPTLGDRSKPELKNMTFEGPGILARSGLRPAICTDHPAIPINYIALCAALAVKSGMPADEALRAITIYAAEAAGIDDQVGSVELGKRCDLVILDGNPLDINSRVWMVLIDGKIVYRASS
jgi:imidazolonepropionase-like amidohydrolase